MSWIRAAVLGVVMMFQIPAIVAGVAWAVFVEWLVIAPFAYWRMKGRLWVTGMIAWGREIK